MIYFIAIWTLLTAICWVIGTAVLNALNAPEGTDWTTRAIASLWLGAVSLAVTLLAVSLALPLSPWVGGAIATGGAGISLLSLGTRGELQALRSRLSSRFLLSFFAIALLIAALMTKQVTWYDTGLYHFGAIRWLEKYGAVPGLALIHSKFGFVSSWFAFAAPLNPERLGSHVSAVMNGFVLLLASLQIVVCLVRIVKGKANVVDGFAVIFLAIALFLMRLTTFMSAVTISPSPDIPVILLTGMVAWTMLLIASHSTACIFRTNPRTDARAIPLILGAGAVTMKLSALPLLCIAWLFYLFDEGEKMAIPSVSEALPRGGKFKIVGTRFRRAMKGSAIATVLLLPMLGVNLLISGCPLYPSPLMCLNFPWSIPIAKTVAERTAINGWLSWFGSPPAGENAWLWLFKEWWNLANFNKVMVAAIALSVAISIYIFKTLRFNLIKPFLWLFALAALGIFYIMTQAPLVRFGLGYFLAIPALLLAVLCDQIGNLFFANQVQKISRIVPERRLSLLGLLLASLVIVIMVRNDPRDRLLLPPELPQSKIFEQQVNDIDYFLPVNSTKCWAAPQPCTPDPISPTVRLRNPERGLAAGFVTHIPRDNN